MWETEKKYINVVNRVCGLRLQSSVYISTKKSLANKTAINYYSSDLTVVGTQWIQENTFCIHTERYFHLLQITGSICWKVLVTSDCLDTFGTLGNTVWERNRIGVSALLVRLVSVCHNRTV